MVAVSGTGSLKFDLLELFALLMAFVSLPLNQLALDKSLAKSYILASILSAKIFSHTGSNFSAKILFKLSYLVFQHPDSLDFFHI